MGDRSCEGGVCDKEKPTLNSPQPPGSRELLQHPQHLLAAVSLDSESNTVDHLAGKDCRVNIGLDLDGTRMRPRFVLWTSKTATCHNCFTHMTGLCVFSLVLEFVSHPDDKNKCSL